MMLWFIGLGSRANNNYASSLLEVLVTSVCCVLLDFYICVGCSCRPLIADLRFLHLYRMMCRGDDGPLTGATFSLMNLITDNQSDHR